MKKKNLFIIITTFLVFGCGLMLTYYKPHLTNSYSMYFIGGAFSVLMLITALTEEGFNPGNYLFYCIIVLIGGMITDTIMKNVAAKGIGKFGFLAIFVLLLASLSIVSQYFYCATMNKGIRDREGK